MSQAHYTTRGAVAVITLDNPPVNGLGHALRSALVEGLDRAAADPAVKAIVVTGAGKAFSGGADIKEFDSPKALAEPNLHSLIRVVEESPKPVVAAIHSVCMGGGLELSLACHYRVASPGAQIGLPEVKLGLLPGAGGTQRLPRVVGVERALDMIVSGNPVPSEKLAGTRLLDAVIEGDLVAGAVAFAETVAGVRPLPLVRDIRVEDPRAAAFVGFARTAVGAVAKDYPAPPKCVDAVEVAATKPFEEGLAWERAAFLALVQTPESRALRHAFFAERAASKIPDVPEDTPTRPVRSAAVVGAGTMGGGIAMNFANAGIPVAVLEVKKDALDRGIATIRKNYEATARKGKLTAAQVEERMALVRPTLDYADLAQADIVVEAVFEDMAVKEAVFRKLDEVMKPGAILATNTSTLDVDRIASFTRRPQDVVGTHFFSPANVMKLLEIVRGKETAKDVLATVMALSKKLRKTGVVSGVCDGFIGNRMLHRYFQQCWALLLEGALPQQVDRAMERFGFVMGPFRVSDLAGNDVGWYIRKRHYAEHPDSPREIVADRICELGRFGQKTGAGWYRYEPGARDPIPDPVVEEIVVGASRELGVARRRIPDREIVERCVYALVNEGARILEEGIALRASDVDMVYLTGYGFPVFRGGPMRYADEVGLWNVARSMNRFAAAPGPHQAFWKPAALLARLAAEGRSFT
ncbi:MAG TPA: 3-hydroxyacyl-CoA dehydrogenase NAD-binding domain-containing protein [Anaeromyxobacteraceae bacterium]|nr:3-hydroxyacyl-CoA dehydrogenase NAD-binding domain-containing protein [Anaeromyxobacteraceae bacterium]